jgi:hypothetical protein
MDSRGQPSLTMRHEYEYLLNSEGEEASSERLDFGSRASLIFLLGIYCIGFWIADVATPQISGEPVLALLCLGIVTAQLTVISVWGTLVHGTFLVRLPWTLLLLTLSWCGFVWGISIEQGGPKIDSMIETGMVWMVGFVTSFVPLKIAAMCFGWQIIKRSGNSDGGLKDSRYTIKDMMLGTLLLAVSMGIGRWMLRGEAIDLVSVMQKSIFNQRYGLFLLSIYGVISLLVKLPCIWISLGEKHENVGSMIGKWIFYCSLLVIFETCFFMVLLGPPPVDILGEMFVGLLISHQVMGASVLIVCLTLRGLGYRMERSFRRRSTEKFS